ncbi:hypothetical protein [Sphingobacterium gobiense]|uniref:Uncharacterized protein n=1 Tax=Sphingobacterium gobiense TaxID=1382456 RepID=A0A2S9JNC2_9SPHI|nr:hypothetical protein [Sphingobacterium gobiense]PRD54660.1 hypothetical protein C5749_14585 [Sphingobacterium gobiense]
MFERWALILLIIFPNILLSQEYNKSIQDSTKELKPGIATSILFHVDKLPKKQSFYDIDVETSSSHLTPILASDGLQLSDKLVSTLIVPIKISSSAPPGIHQVVLHIKDKTSAEQMSLSEEIRIKKIREISLSKLDVPTYVKAGDTITASFILKNGGNVEQVVKLESNVGTIARHPYLILTPGETRIVQVNKMTDITVGKRTIQNIDIIADSPDSTFTRIAAYGSTNVIPVTPTKDDIYHRFPVSASISYIGMRNRGSFQQGFQGEVYGRGSLNTENTAELEFRALTKNPVDFNTFTPYEEYFATFRNKKVYAHLGDKVYSSSFLTEYARYGRGAELKIELGKVAFGGFYNRPRFFREIKDEFNIYSTFHLDSTTTISGGYLLKIPERGTSTLFRSQYLTSSAHLPYLIGKTTLLKQIDVEAEIAMSKMDNAQGAAYRVRADGYYKQLYANLAYMHATPSFAGYFNNSSMFNGNIRLTIAKKIDLLANYTQDAQNFRRDTMFLAAPYRNNMRYGVNFRYSETGNITFYNGYQRYRDRQTPRQFDYNELFFRTSLYQRLWDFDLDLEGQLGKTDNHITGLRGSSSYLRAGLGFEKFNSSFNVFGSIARTSRYRETNQSQLYYGARVMSRLSAKSSLHVFYQNDFLPEEYFRDRNLFELLFRQQFLPAHSIDISGRYMLQRGQLGHKDFVASIRYTAQLNLPVKKTASYTTLSGTVASLGATKIGGIRLMLGKQQAITDSEGNYVFKNIVPGEHFLEIDRTTFAFEDIPDVPLPISIFLSEDRNNTFNFGLTEAAKITGTLALSAPSSKDLIQMKRKINPKKKTEVAKVIIEASFADQVLRKICALGEDFDFTYLRPGDWTVKIYGNDLDSRYSIPNKVYQLSLKSGQTQHVVVPVTKRESKIQYQQQSITVSYNENINE